MNIKWINKLHCFWYTHKFIQDVFKANGSLYAIVCIKCGKVEYPEPIWKNVPHGTPL